MCGRMKRPPFVGALGHEAIEAGVFGEDVCFLREDVADGVFIFGQRRRKGIRASGFESGRIKIVVSTIPLLLMHADGWFNDTLSFGGCFM